MFLVGRIIQLTLLLSCCTVRIFFNVDTDTVVILVAKKFTKVQVFDKHGFYLVVLQTSISEEVKAWEVKFAISI